MAFVLKDRVGEQTTTEGTGALALTGVPMSGYQSVASALSTGDVSLFCVRAQNGAWNTFLGTWNASTQTLARTTILDGSSGRGVASSLTGASEVWITQTASHDPAVLNVRDFGAVGDGTTDDTSAIQAALTAVTTAGATVLFPAGYSFAVSTTLNVKSKTTVTGGGRLVARAIGNWPSNAYWAFKNVNFSASVITDTDIVFDGIEVDWSAIGSGAYGHIFYIRKAQRVIVQNCRVLGGASVTALLGCDDTLVQGNRFIDFINCGVDHWDGPSNARVIGNYLASSNTAQMVNFNPDPTTPPSTGYVASGFTMSGNVIVGTGATSEPTQVEPLRASAYVVGVSITGNQFRNATLVMRGDVRSASVAGNTFEDIDGIAEVITNYDVFGSTASGLAITGNVIRNPATASPNLGVIRTESVSSNTVGNVILGSGYSVAGIYRGAPAVGYASANYVETNPNVGQFQRGGRLDNGGLSVWGWRDSAGSNIDMYCQADNNWRFVGTDSTGAERSIAFMFQRSNSSLFFWEVPVGFNATIRQYVAQIAAAGTTIGSATDIVGNVNEVTSATGGVATGVRLLAAGGMKQTVINSTAISINCYPNNSGSAQIDNGGANIPVAIAAGKSKTFVLVSANNFRTVAST